MESQLSCFTVAKRITWVSHTDYYHEKKKGLVSQKCTMIASMDYCYTLDLRTFTWTQQNISAPSVDLVRSRHNGKPPNLTAKIFSFL